MSDTAISQALDAADSALRSGESLKGTGFWKAVREVRRRPELAARFADRIGEIDRRAFEQGVALRVPAWVGTVLLSTGTLAGAFLLWLTPLLEEPFLTGGFLVGFGVLVITTHSLTHWLVGRLMGMRFTHYFLGGPSPPRPGAKLDYSTYLRVPPRRRAIMHASGAVVTKLIPFILLPVALGVGIAGWGVWVLVAVGMVQLITDVLFSTKTSDWKKALREWRARN